MSDALKRITALAELLKEADVAVEAAETALRLAKDTKRRLEEEDLPELMRELGLVEIKLLDGSAVAVSDEVSCGITEFNRPAAHEWLINHDFGGLIKTEIAVKFDRDEREQARDAMCRIAVLLEREVLLDEKVHPQTLKAFVKEQRAAGVSIPTDLFSIRPYAKAKVTPPKVAKGQAGSSPARSSRSGE